ncbi:MFS transporter [Streptomyces sp. NPDC058286]|uniref:MFS transporter n=1 Tax=Streptomyces sp. NPDC058286 TaxID=3346422 RepID=UPI0036E3A120
MPTITPSPWKALSKAIGAEGVFDEREFRRLGLAYLATTVGQGAWVAANVLLFQQTLDMSSTQFGIGRTLSAIAALFCVLPLISMADRIGTIRAARIAHALQVLCIGAMFAVTGFATYVVLLVVLTVVRRVADTLRMTLSTELGEEGNASHARAAFRSLTHAGFAIGSGCAAVPLAVGGRPGLALAVSGYALLAFIGLLSLPQGVRTVLAARTKPDAESSGEGEIRRRSSLLQLLSNRRFVGALIFATVFNLADTVLTFALPLWLATREEVPAWAFSPLLVLNMILIVFLQARLARSDDSISSLRGYFLRSGLMMALALSLYASSAFTSGLWAAAALIAGTAALSLGDIFASGLTWSLPVVFAGPNQINAYNGAVSSVTTLRDTVGPLIIAAFLADGGAIRWYLGAAIFAVSGLAGAWAITRPYRSSNLVPTDG